jgi:hypothetical protein
MPKEGRQKKRSLLTRADRVTLRHPGRPFELQAVATTRIHSSELRFRYADAFLPLCCLSALVAAALAARVVTIDRCWLRA